MDKKKLVYFFLWIPIIVLALINLLTVFTPEIGFDALWYHLTLPKLWLLKKQWFFDGGLLYYSAMPRLVDLLFIPLIKFTGFIGPKFVQYLSGVLACVYIWKITKSLKLSKIYQLISISLFYCTWLVSWESGSVYIDLIRTFLETAALYYFISGFWKKGGIFLGLAIGTKWIALGSLGIYALIYNPLTLIPALLVALPWFLIALYFTGNPIFPIFGPIIHNTFLSLSQIIPNIVLSPYFLTKPFDDFLSPLAGLILLFSIVSAFKTPKVRKIALVGILGTLFSLILDPPSTRFILPYFPALIISAVYCLSLIYAKYRPALLVLVFISAIFIIGLRLYAIQKYIPYLLGREDASAFLTRYSARLPGTFVDSDSYVEDKIPANSKILVNNLHNLFYFPRDFDHTSWVESPKGYDYLVTIEEDPSLVNGDLVHVNPLGIQIFKLKK